MNWEQFMTVQRAIDDRFLEEAHAPITNKKVLYRTLAAAACFCVVLGGVALAGGNLSRNGISGRKMMAAGSESIAAQDAVAEEKAEAAEAPMAVFSMVAPESAAEEACDMAENSTEFGADTFIGNPYTEATMEELAAQGFYTLPENTSDLISCFFINGFDTPIAEINFSKDGTEYCLRQYFCESAEDISGIYDAFSEQELFVNDKPATLKSGSEFVVIEQYLGTEQLQLCLSARTDDTDSLVSLASELFPESK